MHLEAEGNVFIMPNTTPVPLSLIAITQNEKSIQFFCLNCEYRICMPTGSLRGCVPRTESGCSVG